MLDLKTLENKFDAARKPVNDCLAIWDCIEKLFLATKDKLHEATPKVLIKLIEELVSEKTELALKKINFLVLYDQITDKDSPEVQKTKITAFDNGCKELKIRTKQIQTKLKSIPAILIYYSRERLSIDEARKIEAEINTKQFQNYATFVKKTEKYTQACESLKSTRNMYRTLETELGKFINEINMREEIVALLSNLTEIFNKKERKTIEEYQANINLDIKTEFINLLQRNHHSKEIKTVNIIAALPDINTPSNTDSEKGKKVLKQIFDYLMHHQNLAYFEKDVVSTQTEYNAESNAFNSKSEEIKESIFKSLANVSQHICKKLEKDELTCARFIQDGAIDKKVEDFLAKIQSRIQGGKIAQSPASKIDNNSQSEFTRERTRSTSYSLFPTPTESKEKENVPKASLEKKESEEEKKPTNPSYTPTFSTLDIQQERKEEEEKNSALVAKYEKEPKDKTSPQP